MKIVLILAGLTGGFFIERQLMLWTEALTEKTLRSGRIDKKIFWKKFFGLIAVKNIIILLILTVAAACSVTLLLSLSAGIVLYTFFYVVKKNRHIGKTNTQKGSDSAWKE